MRKDVTLTRAPFAYIHAVYDIKTGDYREVEDWYTREQNGLPPQVVLASKKNGKYMVTTAVKNGGVYDSCNFVTSPDPDDGWGVLDAFVETIGWAGAFTRRKLIYHGGRSPWQKALCPANKGKELWYGYGSSSTEFVVNTLERAGVEVIAQFEREIICEFDYEHKKEEE